MSHSCFKTFLYPLISSTLLSPKTSQLILLCNWQKGAFPPCFVLLLMHSPKT